MSTSDLVKWYRAQYVESVGLGSIAGTDRFKAFTAKLPEISNIPNYPTPLAPIRRIMGGLIEFKVKYAIDADGYDCVSLTVSINGVSAIYGYAYWRKTSTQSQPDFICVSPTFKSRDGEYRSRFITGKDFYEAYDDPECKLEPFEDAVLSLVQNNGLVLDLMAYPDAFADIASRAADETRLLIMTFTVALGLDLRYCHQNILEFHTEQKYVTVLKTILDLKPEFHDIKKYHTKRRIHLFGGGGKYGDLGLKCGQKIVPMFVREIITAYDYNMSTWRELIITKAASDLALNFISPSFALFNDWFFVEGVDASLFENAAMKDHYTRANAVQASALTLKDARNKLESAEQTLSVKRLDSYIYESIEFAQSHLLTSNDAMLLSIEHVGVTMGSLPTRIKNLPGAHQSVIDAFTSKANAAKYLFDLAYAVHCLHTKLGVIHCDLHIFNMTLNRWGLFTLKTSETETVFMYDNPVTAVALGDTEMETYIFPATGNSSCIIDYSRAVLGSMFRPHLEEYQTPQFATNFYNDQNGRIFRTLSKYDPDFVTKNADIIKDAIIHDVDTVFKVLSAVDYIAIGAGMTAVFKMGDPPSNPTPFEAPQVRPYIVDPSAIKLAETVEYYGRELYIMALQDLVAITEARLAGKPIKSNIQFAGHALIKKVFAEWSYPKWALSESAKGAKIVDGYNYNNTVKYSGQHYSKWPKWAQFDQIEPHLGDQTMESVFDASPDAIDKAHGNTRIEVLSSQLRAAQEKLFGKPVSVESS